MPAGYANFTPREDRELYKAYRLAVFFEDMGDWMTRHGHPRRKEWEYRTRSDYLIKQESLKRAREIAACDSGMHVKTIIRRDTKPLQEVIDEANARAPEQGYHTHTTPTPAPVSTDTVSPPPVSVTNRFTKQQDRVLKQLVRQGMSSRQAAEEFAKYDWSRSPASLSTRANLLGHPFKTKAGRKKGCAQKNGGYSLEEDLFLKKLFAKGLCATQVAEEMCKKGYERNKGSVYARGKKLGLEMNTRRGRPLKPRKPKPKKSRRTLKCKPGWNPKGVRKPKERFSAMEDARLWSLSKRGMTDQEIADQMAFLGFPKRRYTTYKQRRKHPQYKQRARR